MKCNESMNHVYDARSFVCCVLLSHIDAISNQPNSSLMFLHFLTYGEKIDLLLICFFCMGNNPSSGYNFFIARKTISHVVRVSYLPIVGSLVHLRYSSFKKS